MNVTTIAHLAGYLLGMLAGSLLIQLVFQVAKKVTAKDSKTEFVKRFIGSILLCFIFLIGIFGMLNIPGTGLGKSPAIGVFQDYNGFQHGNYLFLPSDTKLAEIMEGIPTIWTSSCDKTQYKEGNLCLVLYGGGHKH